MLKHDALRYGALKRRVARPLAGLLLFCVAATPCAAAPLRIYAAAAVYADLARQIGGDRIRVETPAHESAAARRERSVDAHSKSTATIALLTGAETDAGGGAPALEASRFASRASGADSYYWYDLDAMRGLAGALTAQLKQADPQGAGFYSENLGKFDAALTRLAATIKDVAYYYRGSDVFVADGLSRRLIDALRFRIVNPAFARGRPSTADENALREGLAERSAAILIYDSDSKTRLTAELVALAKNSGVPVVGVQERLPSALTYQQWMTRQINAVHGALNEAAP